MKLHIKLGLIFSAVTMILMLFCGIFLYSFERESLYRVFEEKLLAVGNRMVLRFEDTVDMMDDNLKSLIANSDFMNALAMQSYMQPVSEENRAILLEGKNLLQNVLQCNPLNTNYNRVNVFQMEGVFYSSQTIDSLSIVDKEQILEIIEKQEWLKRADATPFQPLLLPPYQDPWAVEAGEEVFGIGRAIVWMGRHCGYLEIQKTVEQLAEVFSTEGLDGVEVCALLNGREVLYQSNKDCSEKALNYLDDKQNKSKNLWYEFDIVSENTGLTLYIAQNMSVWNEELRQSIVKIILFLLVALLGTIMLILFAAWQLTRSVRVLKQNIQSVQFEGTAILPKQDRLKKNNEIYQIQESFDALIDRMNVAIHNEIQMRNMHLQAQLDSLQAQINPHFIYNTLNMIAAKGLEYDAPEITELCASFSNMLRYSTAVKERAVSVEEELMHVTNYLELMKARYEEQLVYRIEIPDMLLKKKLPKLTLQPLVENCFVHGFQSGNNQMNILIGGKKEKNSFTLSVRDNGSGFSEEMLENMNVFLEKLYHEEEGKAESVASSSGIGLENTFTRLYIFSEGKARFSLYCDEGAVVELTFWEEV